MFCKWCGNKITNNGVLCPTCGKEQPALENGNGFWDLCEVEPKGGKQGAVPLTSVESPNVSEEKHTQSKRGDHQKAKKSAKKRGNGIVILVLALCFMVVGVIESSIALSRISKCMDEIASVKSQISGLRTDVTNGVAEIEEHIDAAITTDDEENTEEAENNDVKDDLDELLNSDSDISIVNGVISVEAHEIESTKADTLLIVSGCPIEGESTRFVWQQFDAQTEEWNTIAEDQDFILLKGNDETVQVRVLCITQNELQEYTIYGAVYMADCEDAEPEDSTEDFSDSESDLEDINQYGQKQSVVAE